jgi:hypothetical protein
MSCAARSRAGSDEKSAFYDLNAGEKYKLLPCKCMPSFVCCKSVSHSGDYEECYLAGCDAV